MGIYDVDGVVVFTSLDIEAKVSKSNLIDLICLLYHEKHGFWNQLTLKVGGGPDGTERV